ncbi:spore coat polysaccharide biosynthesis protein SpsF (cytidylyltransferase family) [Chryseobacterium sp. MDT2-18]|nr:spore coat polysaccharide biosynthesis protein SpsF (cytidylyltransferase family) [Chryseobacterium sp. MDT2-18]
MMIWHYYLRRIKGSNYKDEIFILLVNMDNDSKLNEKCRITFKI